MDQLLLPYLNARDEIERQDRFDEILLVHIAPIVRHSIRRRLGFYVDTTGNNPHNQDAEDLYQEIFAKVVQALAEPSTAKAIENLQQYVSRIAANACNDVLRSKSPARARLKNNLRYILNQHKDLAVWKSEGDTLAGFEVWRDSSKSVSSESKLSGGPEVLDSFKQTHFARENSKSVPLTRLIAELFRWAGGPITFEQLVRLTATLLEVEDRPVESLDDEDNPQLQARIADNKLTAESRLEAAALLQSLWLQLKELSHEQRKVFCFSFEDESGKDLFTLLLEAEIVNLKGLTEGLGLSLERFMLLWSKVPMDDQTIAEEMGVTKPRVQKWRFRALEKLRKGLLPFSGNS